MIEMPLNDVRAAMQAVGSYAGVPERFTLTLADSLLDQIGINMAMITDRVLAKGWEPKGYDQHYGFRVYHYTSMV